MKISSLVFAMLMITSYSYGQSYNDEIAAYRKKYKEDFLTDTRSPLKAADTGYLRFYDADPAYRVQATLQLTPGSEPFMIQAHSGKKKSYREYGIASFSINGFQLKLHVYQSQDLMKNPKYKDELFIPFTDTTNNVETFGGGRYIDIQTTDIKGNIFILDFNKCYNPYCAFADGYSCPIPPKENSLPIGIKAGEKLFGKSVE